MGPEDIRLGRVLKALRVRKRWRQRDLAVAARVSQTRISRAESNGIGRLRIDEARALFASLGARGEFRVTWDGAGIERLLDRRHAALVEIVASLLRERGWTVVAEVSFNEYGERGSIDVLAWHAPTRSLLVIEVKTEVGAVEATLRILDMKVRLAAGIARKRYGWVASRTSRVLVLPEGRTARRQIGAHATSIGTVMPLGSQELRRWIREPSGAVGGVWFMSAGQGSTPATRRVRITCRNPSRADHTTTRVA